MSLKLLERVQKLDKLPDNRSAFLWGPRKTGKTTLLKQQFPNAVWIDLLDYDLYTAFNHNPKYLRQMLTLQTSKTVIIDEIQKIPQLMDEIHWLIENKGYHFILSGSSARKFKRGDVNLLGGRAWRYELYPFVTKELGDDFNLERAMIVGLIPMHYFSKNPEMDLKSYVQDYLKEEIQAEALTRNLPVFSKFLYTAAITNGMLLNFANVAREVGVAAKTIREYYRILEDTLIGWQLESWKKSNKRRLIETAKFYFFDLGIVSTLLCHKTLLPGTAEFGRAFEHFIMQECLAYRHYSGKDFPIHYWRTASGAEVDIILGDADVAIEIKSSDKISEKPKGLSLFRDEYTIGKSIVVSRIPFPMPLGNDIVSLPWQNFCQQLWAGEII